MSKTKTINLAPNWEATAKMLIVLLRDGNVEGKRYAEEEIIRMGKIIDQMIAQGSLSQAEMEDTIVEDK